MHTPIHRSERGVSLLLVMLIVMLVASVSMIMFKNASTDKALSVNQNLSQQSYYTAESAARLAIERINGAPASRTKPYSFMDTVAQSQNVLFNKGLYSLSYVDSASAAGTVGKEKLISKNSLLIRVRAFYPVNVVSDTARAAATNLEVILDRAPAWPFKVPGPLYTEATSWQIQSNALGVSGADHDTAAAAVYDWNSVKLGGDHRIGIALYPPTSLTTFQNAVGHPNKVHTYTEVGTPRWVAGDSATTGSTKLDLKQLAACFVGPGGVGANCINSMCGTSAAPMVSYMNNPGNLTVSGYGVLIINGSVKFKGNGSFKGLVIVLDSSGTNSTELVGTTDFAGSIMTESSFLKLNGNMNIEWNSAIMTQSLKLGKPPNTYVAKSWRRY